MLSNLDRFKADLKKLIHSGSQLHMAMQRACLEKEFDAQVKSQLKDKADEFLDGLPSFDTGYQRWYSESLALLRQILPDRVEDFIRHYEKPKPRKEINFEN